MSEQVPAASQEEDQFLLEDFWREVNDEMAAIQHDDEKFYKKENNKNKLPLARIRKIMKTEVVIQEELEKDRKQAAVQDVIEASTATGAGTRQVINNENEASKIPKKFAEEAPIFMSRACDLLIRELTGRPWIHTQHGARKTLQQGDVHASVGESETYDFLIDVVPTAAQRGEGEVDSNAGAPQHEP